MNQPLWTGSIGDHHVQQTVTYLDSGTPFVDYYCCRCRTLVTDRRWFETHECGSATSSDSRPVTE